MTHGFPELMGSHASWSSATWTCLRISALPQASFPWIWTYREHFGLAWRGETLWDSGCMSVASGAGYTCVIGPFSWVLHRIQLHLRDGSLGELRGIILIFPEGTINSSNSVVTLNSFFHSRGWQSKAAVEDKSCGYLMVAIDQLTSGLEIYVGWSSTTSRSICVCMVEMG